MFEKLAADLLQTAQETAKLFKPIEGASSTVNKVSDGFKTYFDRIAHQESRGNYLAVNKDSGALGKYQFMPSTLRGMGFDPSNFLNNPAAQEQAMQQYTMKNIQYANQHGYNIPLSGPQTPQDMKVLASGHYGGLRGIRNMNTSWADKTWGIYPSTNGYSNSIARGY